tara:strand:+ start:799 stop:1329 length:531 start_codon:yes stop_codon:yes gene_type:complete
MSEAVTISLEEMDTFLVDAQLFTRLEPEQVGHTCYEYVYERGLATDYAPDCKIRVYSSIGRNGESRSKGSDAIRVVLVDPKGYPFCKAFKRVHRVTGWRANLLNRYEPVLDEPWSYTWQEEYPCPKCSDGILRTRWGKKGSFMGCSNYQLSNPNPCKNTEPVTLPLFGSIYQELMG